MKISKQSEYALISLVHLSSLEEGTLITANGLSDTFKIPRQTIGKVLQALNRAKILRSFKGVHGGYGLSRPLDTIMIGQVIEAIEGPICLSACQQKGKSCDQEPFCNIKGPMCSLEAKMLRLVYNISVVDFMNCDNYEQVV